MEPLKQLIAIIKQIILLSFSCLFFKVIIDHTELFLLLFGTFPIFEMKVFFTNSDEWTTIWIDTHSNPLKGVDAFFVRKQIPILDSDNMCL